jgi:hypothetical protein
MLLTKWMPRLGALFAAGLMAGCTSSMERSVTQSLTTVHGDYIIHCNKTKAEILNQLLTQSGDLLMEMRTTLEPAAEGSTLLSSWSIHRTDGISTDQVRAPAPELLGCENANELAYHIYLSQNQTKDQSGEVPLDNWGCDLRFATDIASCSLKGGCCDDHDACFAQRGCTAASWAHTFACSAIAVQAGEQADPVTGLVLDLAFYCYDGCDLCNITAGICFVGPFLPGPSVCCNPLCYICGIPRNPINPFGCVADCMCPSGYRCDLPTGTCQPVCQACQIQQCGYDYSCGSPPVFCGDCGPGERCRSGTCCQWPPPPRPPGGITDMPDPCG